MMAKVLRLLLTIFISIIFSISHFAQNNSATPKKDADIHGLEIVFVVDVSYSMQWNMDCVKDFIYAVYQELSSPDNPGKNNFHLVTFSDYATYHSSIKEFLDIRDKIEEELKKTLKERRKRTYPKNGLWEVSDLIEENFIKKVGVVLLISDGEDNRKLEMEKFENDMKMSIKALKNIGFSVFPIFVNTGIKKYMRRTCMDKLRELAGTSTILYEIGRGYEFAQIAAALKDDIINNANYNSPKLYKDVIKTEKQWKQKVSEQEKLKKEVEVAKQKSDEKIVGLEGSLLAERIRSLAFKIINNYLALENKKYRSSLKTLWIIFLLTILLGIIGFLGYKYKWYKWFMPNPKTPPSPPNGDDELEKPPLGKKSGEPPLIEKSEKPPLDTLWGKLVDLETRQEYNLMDKENGYTPDCLPGIKLQVENRANKKVIYLRQEEGSIEFRDANDQPCINNCGYIGEDTRSFIIKNCGGIKEKKFEYHFLNKLVDSFDKPILEKEVSRSIKEIEKIERNFIGRKETLEDIKTNFKKEEGEVRTHCLISGMGNSGKTSIMRYMHNVFFPNDSDLNGKYISKLFEFEPVKYKDFSDFENEIEKELNSINAEDKRTRLILIDEYDKIFDKFKDDFGKFLQKIRIENVEIGSLHFFILAGQRGQKLLDPMYKKYIPEHTASFVLSSLDDLKSTSNEKDKSNSIKLIDTLLTDIGFPECYLPDEVKKRIIKFSSGFPYFVKKILHQLLINWQLDSSLHPLREDCVDDVVRNIVIEEEIDATKRACKFDTEFNKDSDKLNAVSVDQIIRILRREVLVKGRINKEDFRDEMSRITAATPDIIKNRKKSFDKKIKQLINMGLMIEDKKDLIPVPHMFFS